MEDEKIRNNPSTFKVQYGSSAINNAFQKSDMTKNIGRGRDEKCKWLPVYKMKLYGLLAKLKFHYEFVFKGEKMIKIVKTEFEKIQFFPTSNYKL